MGGDKPFVIALFSFCFAEQNYSTVMDFGFFFK